METTLRNNSIFLESGMLNTRKFNNSIGTFIDVVAAEGVGKLITFTYDESDNSYEYEGLGNDYSNYEDLD